jgi:hypothetical protein
MHLCCVASWLPCHHTCPHYRGPPRSCSLCPPRLCSMSGQSTNQAPTIVALFTLSCLCRVAPLLPCRHTMCHGPPRVCLASGQSTLLLDSLLSHLSSTNPCPCPTAVTLGSRYHHTPSSPPPSPCITPHPSNLSCLPPRWARLHGPMDVHAYTAINLSCLPPQLARLLPAWTDGRARLHDHGWVRHLGENTIWGHAGTLLRRGGVTLSQRWSVRARSVRTGLSPGTDTTRNAAVFYTAKRHQEGRNRSSQEWA